MNSLRVLYIAVTLAIVVLLAVTGVALNLHKIRPLGAVSAGVRVQCPPGWENAPLACWQVRSPAAPEQWAALVGDRRVCMDRAAYERLLRQTYEWGAVEGEVACS